MGIPIITKDFEFIYFLVATLAITGKILFAIPLGDSPMSPEE